MNNLVNPASWQQDPDAMTQKINSNVDIALRPAENLPSVRAQLSEHAARQDFRRQLGWGLRESARG